MLKTREEMENNIYSSTLSIRTTVCYLRSLVPSKWTTASYGQNTLTDFDAHMTEVTLSTGSVANAVLYAPGASNTAHAHRILCSVGLVGMGAQNYLIEIEDEDDALLVGTNFQGAEQLNLELYQDCSASADKDVETDVSGGSAAEKLYFIYIGGKHT